MNEFFKELILKAFCGGVICTLAMMFSEGSAAKEPVRICCACLMIAILVSPITRGLSGVQDIKYQSAYTENSIEQGISDALREEDALIAENIAEYVERRAKELGISCKAEIECENRTLKGAVIYIKDEDREGVENILLEECGIDEKNIFWRKD